MGKLMGWVNRIRGHSDMGSAGSTLDFYDATSTTNIYNNTQPRKVSLAQLTMEALPREEHYQKDFNKLGRPSLGQVHGEHADKVQDVEKAAEEEHEHEGHAKLGWIQGCLIQCILNIWGVMLFLRLSWIVGQAGILESLIIVLISTIVCVITTLALSAICTNGQVKGGGIYYIISRSIGPEFGASIGIVFAFANAVAAAMNTIGFCSSLNTLLQSEGYKIIDNGDNDTRIIGTIALMIMAVICVVGMEYEVLANDLFMVVISGAILDFLVGAAIGPPSQASYAKGFVGFSRQVFAQNFPNGYRFSEGMDQSIVTCLAIFFPSVTGIQAGANISGDLKDASMAIPKGTLLSILITMISYALFIIFAGGAAVRDASGNIPEIATGQFTNCTYRINTPDACQYGLMNDYTVMQLMSGWGPLIYAGCFAATLSTAITNLLSVPKILQALGKDRIYPGLQFFSKGYFKSQEPLRGYILTVIISTCFLLIANLNAIAPLISNFYLVSYGMINFCTFHAEHVKPVGWRPTFKYNNKWVSLAGAIICTVIMFIISWITSLITFIIIIALYMIVVYRKPDVNWGSSKEAQTFKGALDSALSLGRIQDHAKTYRPQVLVLTGKPQYRPPLLDLANLITKHRSMLVCGEISKSTLTHRDREAHVKNCYKYLEDNKIEGFYSLVDGLGFEEGAKSLMQTSGIGKLKPNVLMLGYKSDWQTCINSDLNVYFKVLHDAFTHRLGVIIVRLPDGVNYSKVIEEEEDQNNLEDSIKFLSTIDVSESPILFPADSNLNIHIPNSLSDNTLSLKGGFLPSESPTEFRNYTINQESPLKTKSPKECFGLKKKKKVPKPEEKVSVIPHETMLSMTFFQRKHKKQTIDVWWLYDDGGLTILIPYIISLRKNWVGAKLRIFALANRVNELDLEEINMAKLLGKLRIDYTCLKMVKGIMDKPKPATTERFNKLLDSFKADDENTNKECLVTDEELETLRAKTDRQLRIKELLMENSKSSGLVIMSLPMPRKEEVSAPLYMAWLETITSDMPPFMLIRGNHTSVLTFDA